MNYVVGISIMQAYISVRNWVEAAKAAHEDTPPGHGNAVPQLSLRSQTIAPA